MKSNFSTPGFLWPLLTLVCLVLILTGLNAVLKKTGWNKTDRQRTFFGTAAFIIIWTTLLVVLSCRGFFSDFSKMPLRPLLAVVIPLPFVLVIAFSKKGTQLLRAAPSHWLVYMQSFRIVVELLLLFAFLAGKLPVQMTFEGRNFDVATGILALPAGWLLAAKRSNSEKFAVAFNITGILLLVNVLIVAVLSMPTPFRYFMNEPANTLVAQFPVILLPGILVPVAYGLHIFSLRQMFIKRGR